MDTNKPFIYFGIDVIAWAYANDGDDCGPGQDWDILLADPRNEDVLLQLASDEHCPKRIFFLHCLYILVGDYVHVLHAGVALPFPIEPLLTQATASSDPMIKTWLERSRYLIAHPETFDYDLWCSGDLIRKDNLRISMAENAQKNQ
jgi:hypothetical protein